MTKLIIPILNSSSTLLRGPAHYLDNVTRIDKLSDAEFGLVSKTPAEYASRFKTEHRCIFVDLPNSDEVDTVTAQLATKLRYVLNHFMSDHPLLLEFAVFSEKNSGKEIYMKPRPINFGEDPSALRKKISSFSVRSGTKREDISQFYTIVQDVCKKYKRLHLTLGRFNSALTRAKITDRIIDATISLESMVQDDKNELSFKFALLNSYAATKDHTKRMAIFELLKKLYNTRSTIVHGAGDETKEHKLVSDIDKNWIEIQDISRRVINEFIFYSKDNDPKTWTSHLLEQIIVPKALSTEA